MEGEGAALTPKNSMHLRQQPQKQQQQQQQQQQQLIPALQPQQQGHANLQEDTAK